jgi:hypothetical protein
LGCGSRSSHKRGDSGGSGGRSIGVCHDEQMSKSPPERWLLKKKGELSVSAILLRDRELIFINTLFLGIMPDETAK